MHASACTDRLVFTNASASCVEICVTVSVAPTVVCLKIKKRPLPLLAKLRLLDRLDRFSVEVLSCPCSSGPAFLPRHLMHRKARKPSPDSGAWTALQGHADRLQSFTRSDLRNAVRRGERVVHTQKYNTVRSWFAAPNAMGWWDLALGSVIATDMPNSSACLACVALMIPNLV